MMKQKCGTQSFVINLACNASASYADCPFDSIKMNNWRINAKPKGNLNLTIQGAAGCTGAMRPVVVKSHPRILLYVGADGAKGEAVALTLRNLFSTPGSKSKGSSI